MAEQNQMYVGSCKEQTTESTNSNFLASTLKYLQESKRSIYQLSNASGADAAYVWRLLRGERKNVL